MLAMNNILKTINLWKDRLSIPFAIVFPNLANILISILSKQKIPLSVGNHSCVIYSSIESILSNCVITFIFGMFFYSVKNKKIISIIYIVIVYIPSLINVISFFLSSKYVLGGSVDIALNSDTSEIFYFIRDRINIKIALTISIYLMLMFRLLSIKSIKPLKGIKKYHFISLSTLAISVLCFSFLPINVIITAINKHLEEIKEISRCRNHLPLTDITSAVANQKQTYVIVIGESVDRKHMSIYGYDRKTTPHFDRIKNELFTFKNVLSGFDNTTQSVKSMLQMHTLMHENIIIFLKDAGFKIFWFSNQGGFSLFDNQVEKMSQLSDVYKFINRNELNKNEYPNVLDEKLLYYLNEALDDRSTDKKIIFLHLIGSHTPIDERFPAEFDVFKLPHEYYDKRKALMVCYFDNSILYTDHVLNQAINMLRSRNDCAWLLYLSDHGQDIYDTPESKIYRELSQNSPHVYEIPFVVWTSEKYKNLNKDFVDGWDIEKKYTTSNLAYSIADLARLRHRIIDRKKSIFYNQKEVLSRL